MMKSWISSAQHMFSIMNPGWQKCETPCTPRLKKQLVVVVMGATGTGKSKLSIDLAKTFPAEVINSDKMQVYRGLDVVTNKITEEERRGVRHHLLGTINPNSEFTAQNFCDEASSAVNSIASRGRLPIIVGGSNSFIEALVDDKNLNFLSIYDCCFLWIDVSMPVLHKFVSRRVDEMVKKGMVDEAREIFDPCADYSIGIRKSIGVPELDRYLRNEYSLDEESKEMLLHECVSAMKYNTCKLANRQLEKIRRLRNEKRWNIHRIDATEVFLKNGKEADEAWEKSVAKKSISIVYEALYGRKGNAKTAASSSMRTCREFSVTV